MAKFNTKHPEREQKFSFNDFSEGLNKEISAMMLPKTALSQCKNMKYAVSKAQDGTQRVVLKKRQGTTKISNTALGSAADVLACTYYKTYSLYIIATDAKLYYLDGSLDPVELGDLDGIPTFTEFNGKLIIHDSGRTKVLNNTTLSTMNSYVVDEAIETGNNSDVDFSGTLAHAPIVAGSLVITYTDTTEKTITDAGDGTLTGDIAADTNTINYTTGEYAFRCSGAPDNTTTVYASYEYEAMGPKSKAGMVRASRLYMWGDSDNPSRLWYSGVNDEDAWNYATGGYLDVDKDDGYSLTGCLNYFQTLVLIKENSLHLLENFPGDDTFRVEPLITDLGSMAYRTCLNDGDLISFISNEGWVGMSSTQRFGDIQKTADLSKAFRTTAVRYANSSAYAEYNQIDKQIWLALYDGTYYLPDIYVINLSTGGQLSQYEFAFTSTCFKFVNGEMLIGGSDGHLYKLVDDDSTFLDDGVSYATDPGTFFRSAFVDFGMPFNRKHNKKLICHAYGKGGVSANLDLYRDETYLEFDTSTLPFTTTTGDLYINPDGNNYYIYDLTGYINTMGSSTIVKKKFNYRNLMFGVTDIEGTQGAEFYGVDFVSAIIGE